MRRKLLVLGILLTLFYAVLVEPYWMKVTHQRIVMPKLTRSLRILFLSDLQLHGPAGTREKWIQKQVANLQFDLVVTTGDLFDTPEGMPGAIQVLSQFSKRAPTYAVLGNWEHWSKANLGRYKSDLAQRSVRLLVNENHTLQWSGTTLSILGVNDSSQALHNLPLAMKNVPANSLKILLAHGPIIFPQASANGIDLMLAGHAHGGQVRLPFFKPFFLPPGCGPYYYGIYKREQSAMVVTSGVGTSILPVRFWCRPEIVMVTLDSGNQQQS